MFSFPCGDNRELLQARMMHFTEKENMRVTRALDNLKID